MKAIATAIIVGAAACLALGAMARPLIDRLAARISPQDLFENPIDDPDRPNVLLLGDSISIGYSKAVQRLLPEYDVFRAPENTENSFRLLTNLSLYLGGKAWAAVHYNAGLHDLKHVAVRDPMSQQDPVEGGAQLLTADEYRANMEMIAERLRGAGASVIFATTTPIPVGAVGRTPGAEVEFNRIAVEVALSHGFCIDDLHGEVSPIATGLQLPNNVHFTDMGYSVLGAAAARSIAHCIAAESHSP